MRNTLTALVTVFLSFFVRSASADDAPNDILIIANMSVPANSVTVVELQDLFLKNRIYWSGMTKAIPINAPSGSKIRAEFRERVLKMTASAEQQHWQNRKIKDGVVGPPEFENTMKAVFKLSGGISYIFRAQYKQGVAKILLVIPSRIQ